MANTNGTRPFWCKGCRRWMRRAPGTETGYVCICLPFRTCPCHCGHEEAIDAYPDYESVV